MQIILLSEDTWQVETYCSNGNVSSFAWTTWLSGRRMWPMTHYKTTATNCIPGYLTTRLSGYISVTVPHHLRPILKPVLRLNPQVDHCLYNVWTTVQHLLREIYRTTATQKLLVFCCPLHLTLSIYRVWTAFNTWPIAEYSPFTQSTLPPLDELTFSVVHVTLRSALLYCTYPIRVELL